MSFSNRLAAARKSHIPAVTVLAGLNLWISWRLFKIEYTDHFSSIEGVFIGIARYISRHWGDFSWWPLWHCGMPYQDTYVPLLHLVVASLATAARISPAHAYHSAVGFTYAMGPVTLYLMAVGLGSGRGPAFLSALLYSLCSPSTWLMADMARDVGSLWSSRRLQVLTSYGEGPHITAMTLLPLVVLALENALRKRTGRSLALAAVCLALLFLTNVPGTMATGLAVFCWLAAQEAGRRRAAWLIAGGAAILGYAVACYGLPPSSVGTVLGNVGRMHQGFSQGLKSAPFLLVVALIAVAVAGRELLRTRLPLVLRFALLYFALLVPMVLSARPQTFEMLPQVGRLHLEMELAASLLLGSAAWAAYSRTPRWLRPMVLVLCLAPLDAQIVHYRARAYLETRPADLANRSEYATARWLDANRRGQRVYVTGSESFWWNAFTDNPQLIGCCDQGQSMRILAPTSYLVNTATGPAETELARSYLQALGVQALVASGPQSTDAYKDIRAPDRFSAVLPVLEREHGDTIYAVPQRTPSLAHVMRAGEAVPPGRDGIADPRDVARYAAVIEDSAHPLADFTWLRGDTARIRTTLAPGDLISVQVAWFNGWRASAGGRPVPVSADGLGFLLLHPGCQGSCEITLRWVGRPDRLFSAVISCGAMAFLGLLCFRSGRR